MSRSAAPSSTPRPSRGRPTDPAAPVTEPLPPEVHDDVPLPFQPRPPSTWAAALRGMEALHEASNRQPRRKRKLALTHALTVDTMEAELRVARTLAPDLSAVLIKLERFIAARMGGGPPFDDELARGWLDRGWEDDGDLSWTFFAGAYLDLKRLAAASE